MFTSPPRTAHTPFKTWVLKLCWILQLIILPINVIALAVLVGIMQNSPPTAIESVLTFTSGVQAWNVVDLVLSSIGLLLVCIEITMYNHSDLTPSVFLGFNIAKLVIWTPSFVLELYSVIPELVATTIYIRVYYYAVIVTAGLI
jgi:hypothetical protein